MQFVGTKTGDFIDGIKIKLDGWRVPYIEHDRMENNKENCTELI